jgi:hypothetical protein
LDADEWRVTENAPDLNCMILAVAAAPRRGPAPDLRGLRVAGLADIEIRRGRVVADLPG